MPSDNTLRRISIARIIAGATEHTDDAVAVEEPLELRVGGRSVAVVMRTPGHDRELAAGFLVTEGLLHRRDDLLDLVHCRGHAGVPEENILDAVLAPAAAVEVSQLTRHLFTSSSCGICSKATIAAVQRQFAPLGSALPVSRDVLAMLPARARQAQKTFAVTGGLHAAGLFTLAGEPVIVREDVGRHNAVDKVVGHAFLAERLPLTQSILFVSGRVAFEIMQKALAAGIPCVAAVSAPTSAAVDFARASGQTLVGFLRNESETSGTATRMNVYAGSVE